jgi:hypothetical protein
MTATFLLTCLTLTLPALPDEVRLRDGRVLVGTTRTNADQVEVRTRDGETIKVPLADVERMRTEAELRAELDALAGQAGRSPFAQLELARLAHGYALDDEMWRHLDQCLAARPEGAARARVDQFLGQLEPVLLPLQWRKREVDIRVRELLFRVRGQSTAAQLRAIESVLAGMPDADAAIRKRARSLNPAQRLVAVRALDRRQHDGNDRFVWRTIVLDPSAANRRHAAELVHSAGTTGPAVEYLASGLLHDRLACRLRTAEALGMLGSEAAAMHLASTGPTAVALAAGGGAPVRANMAVLTQTSYVRDFDVEVAQAAAIANPQVDVITSGVVLDATVAAVTEHRYLTVEAWRNALRRSTGEDPGPDPSRWGEFVESWRKRRAAATGGTKTGDR